MRNFSTILPNYASIVHAQQKNGHQIRFIALICSSNHIISSKSRKPDHTSKEFHGWAELDTDADTTFAGRNCTILHHTERSRDVAPFSDTYEPMKDVDILSSATGFTSLIGRQYILVFNEALYIPELDNTLINTNQLIQFHTQVQESPNRATEPKNSDNQSRYFTYAI